MNRLTLFGLRCDRNAGVLRAGEPQPVVHPGIQRGLSAGIHLWLFAGSVAVWAGRRRVVVRCAATLVAGRKIGLAVPGFAVGEVASYVSTPMCSVWFLKKARSYELLRLNRQSA